MHHTQGIRETLKCYSGQKPPGLWSTPEHHPWERPCQTSCDLPMHPTKQLSTAFISTPEHLCALLEVSMEQRSRVHVSCCGRDTQLCSAASYTAQAIYSSHKQPLLATCMLMAPHFLPPALLPQSHQASRPSALALLGSGVGQTLPHQLGTRSMAASSCCARMDMPACGGKPGTSGFVKGIKHPSGHTDLVTPTRTFFRHPFTPVCSAGLLCWRGGTAQEPATHTALACHGGQPVRSQGREVMASHWPSLEKISLRFKNKTRCVSSHTDTNPPAPLLLCCAPVPFPLSALPEPIVLQCAFVA